MKFLHDILEKQKPMFEKGGKLEKFYYLFEAGESFAFTPSTTTPAKGAHIRDAIDLKRMMMTVVIAMIPALLFGIWNVGYQHFLAIGNPDAALLEIIMIGAIQVLPIVIVAYTAGGIVEVIFGIIRKHPINEGFLVTGMLIPLVMPPDIPLWQVALATVFAVVIAKEAFGGTGMNILNVALTARAFLYFAYPTDISGSKVWTYLGGESTVDGYTGATALSIAAEAKGSAVTALSEATSSWAGAESLFSFNNMLIGVIPGSIGETSALMALLGAIILVGAGVASWKIMASGVVGALVMGLIFNFAGGSLSADTTYAAAFMQMPSYYHLVMGGFAFGIVFMATDPVSAAQTETGKWIYGFFIGLLTVLIRVFNPAYPEGIMLAILLMNVFAPLIDFYVINANKNRRLKRSHV
ncbi:NADH:ubiquinone oxidoreductase, Na(+)-translocating, B subunit [Bernardetia litoralis DSM 6794]|uniref:Na(+)-translocating NADH-quinone reductase subunit B n=1 Tax=Bernardetia litoralis (strain ATCC 23117 / DSM 6794 / NBRC 15988 / NCIMB 1366 / Fx l1 / Sio-4) TaxID=880071 RepID=I4ALH3_BERLS|nr:NADH:ubiquinone reductase (Na(+)-transporting) subunit B [Bernardetia litoralis]AFM04808.1 NADH:ubiquinone oxidoreductase, Na(+)-translocating, B subunit [Bernardetia litoralis DSM 6794]